MELHLVEWVDSFSLTDRWMTPEALEEEYKPMVCLTIGFKIQEDDGYLVLAQSYSMKPDRSGVEEWGHVWAIPQVSILRRVVVESEDAFVHAADYWRTSRRESGEGSPQGLPDAAAPDEAPRSQLAGRDVLVSLLADEGSETGGEDA